MSERDTPERRPPFSQDRLMTFGLTENERRYYTITDERVMTILEDEQTTIHDITVDSNNYGEFLFVTTSREVQDKPVIVTFYGLGHHEYREQWFTNEWSWYEAHPITTKLRVKLDKEEALQRIQERRDDIAPYVTDKTPSKRAQLFSMIADLTDDDGAIAEMEDLGNMLDFFDDENQKS